MKKYLSIISALMLLIAGLVWAADNTYTTGFYVQQGADRAVVASGGSLDVESGGEIDIESGGSLKLGGTAITSSAAELNYLDITTIGTVQASKAIVVDSSSVAKGGTFSASTISGGTFTGSITNSATITGGTLTSVTLSGAGGTLSSPTITSPTVTGGTFTSSTGSSMTLTTPTVTGGTLTSSTLSGVGGTLTAPTITGGSMSAGTFTTATITAPTVTSLDTTWAVSSHEYTTTDDWEMSGTEAKSLLLTLTSGDGAGDRNIIAPDVSGRLYIVRNDTTAGGSAVIKKSGGTGVSIASGKTATVIHNGSDYIRVTADATH